MSDPDPDPPDSRDLAGYVRGRVVEFALNGRDAFDRDARGWAGWAIAVLRTWEATRGALAGRVPIGAQKVGAPARS